MPEPGAQLTPKQAKATMFMLVFANSLMPVMLLFVSAMIANRPDTQQTIPDAVAYGIALASLVGAVGFAVAKLSPFEVVGGTDLTPIATFQTRTLIALTIAEFGALIGFVAYLSNESKYWPLALATVAVDVLAILPRVLAYWRAYEEQNGPPKG